MIAVVFVFFIASSFFVLVAVTAVVFVVNSFLTALISLIVIRLMSRLIACNIGCVLYFVFPPSM